jgi:hypothetical protein
MLPGCEISYVFMINPMATVAGILVAAIALLAAFFAFLNWRTAQTYRPSVEQVLSILDAVLANRVTYLAWDEFVCVPIRHDAELERVRFECVALEQDCYIDYKPTREWRGDAGFNAKGLARIAEIRDSLMPLDLNRA